MNKTEAGVISPAIIAVIVIVLVGIVASVAINVTMQGNENNQTITAQIDENATYEDGEYSAVGTYVSPGGLQTIDLTVTIENNVIVATSLQSEEADAESQGYINQFIGGYEVEVIGREVNEVELSRIAGSSLTSNGFNDALNDIREQAQS